MVWYSCDFCNGIGTDKQIATLKNSIEADKWICRQCLKKLKHVVSKDD